MKIRTRLQLNSYISLSVVFLTILSLVWSFREASKAEENKGLVVELRQTAFERIVLRDEYLLNNEERVRVQWDAKSETFRGLLELARQRFTKTPDKALCEEIRKDFERTVPIFSKIVENRAREKNTGKGSLFSPEGEKRLLGQLILNAYTLQDSIGKLHEAAEKTSTTAHERIVLFLIIFIALVVVTTVGNSAIVNRILTRRIVKLREGTEIIGDGNLDHCIEIKGDDELSALALASNEMTAKLKESYTSVENLQKEIAERKRAEESLQESEKKYRDVVDNSLVGVYITTLKGDILFVNEATRRFYEFDSIQEMISGGAVARYKNPKDRDIFLENLKNTGKVESFEVEMLTKTGKTKTAIISATLTGDVLEGMVLDITERKLAVEELRQHRDHLDELVKKRTEELQGEIDERRHAEEKLREASLYTRSLIEVSLDPLVTISRDGKITDVNGATERVTGVPRAKLIGNDFSDYFTEPEKAREGYREVFEKGFVRDYPLAIRHISGSITDVLYNAAVYKDASGNIAGVFAAARDVTERKRAEEKLHEASLYTRSLIEASLDAFVTISPEGKITDVNKATELVTGVPREQLIGSDFSDYFTEPGKTREGYQQVLKKGFVKDYLLAIRHISGSITDVLYNATVYKDDSGNVAGVFAASRDITERVRAEELLKENEERFRSLVLATAQIVWTTNAQGELVKDLPAWRNFTGQTEEEITGWGWASALHPDDQRRTEAIWSEAVKSRTLYDTEFRIRRHDGEYRWFAVRGVPVLEKDGSVREWVGTCTDITERKLAEEEVKKLNEDLKRHVILLEAANKELEAFSYSVSHDLRAPLRHLAGFVELLNNRSPERLDEKSKHYLKVISDSGQQMGKLVDDLLSFSRMGRSEMTEKQVDLKHLVKEILKELQADMEGRNILWKIDPLPEAYGDASMLRLALFNLIHNAIKFTRRRSEAQIEIGCISDDQKENTFFVRDNGVGFDMRYVDKLFGLFQRLHRAEEFEGTGLGLANVQRIIHRHGGRTWAEGSTEGGATFYFSLPKQTAVSNQQSAEDQGAKAES